MKHTAVSLAVVLVVSSAALSGPLFDDYLNHVRPGPGTEPGTETAAVSAEHPLGQTFSVDDQVGEIYRIGLRPIYETWQPGETVTLTLYASPDRGEKLATYAIEEATAHVQPIHNTRDRVLYWHLRAPTRGRTTFYFELTVAGGDGQVLFQSLPDRRGLSHVVHIKPIADREANLRRFFTERVNLDRSELATVKQAVTARDWERAIAALAMHFHSRQDLWTTYSAVLQERPRLDADTELADLIMNNQLRHVETKQPVAWRPQDYWIPEYKTERAQPKHAVEPSLYHWHVDRFLSAAYTNTGKPEYARRAIDLRMQFVLDNPNPKTTGATWYFELWNDRTAAARAPGHGLLPYVRMYDYDGWTHDERLVFFSFIEDNARWDYKADSGANWGAEAAKACYEFGLKFPEWTMSPEYVRWGTHRLAEIVLADVRGDGTSTEAAIKYHAMVARRLKGMLKDHVDGHIQLEETLLARLMKTVEGMYEHMAHTLMPNSFVVMCGDSWYENYAYKPTLDLADLLAPRQTLGKFAGSKDPLSRLIRERIADLPPEARKAMDESLRTIDAYDGSSEPSEELLRTFVAMLNKLISPGSANPNEPESERISEAWLYDAKTFEGIALRPQTRSLLRMRPVGSERELLSRLLIEDAWPDEIRKGYLAGELHDAARLVNRPDFTWIASQGLEGRPPEQAGKIFSDAGYFIMRSDFGAYEPGAGGLDSRPRVSTAYRDARQLFIHNGNWFGSHGHWDLTSVNLYAFGRPLIIDPGQYEYEPPPGIDRYWNSSIHSMLVPDKRDCRRMAGPSEWVSNPVLDWFDGRHSGFARAEQIGDVRRRIAFVKPDYFVIDDSAESFAEANWAQCWNLTDTNATFDAHSGTIATTFDVGGNVRILNQNPARLSVEIVEGITAAKTEYPKTRIFRLAEVTRNPRFQTLVYPYDGASPPQIDWSLQRPDTAEASDLTYALQVSAGGAHDWMAMGRRGQLVSFADGRHAVNADFALVRLDPAKAPARFAWAGGESLAYDGQLLAAAMAPVHALSVVIEGDTLSVDAPESESTLRIRAGSSKRFVLNGKPVSAPVVIEGLYHPFADEPRAFVADNRDRFQTVTETDEWDVKASPGGWAGSYLQHETDPGRHENGVYLLDVPEQGRYRVQAFLPRTGVVPSERVEYRVTGRGKPVEPGGPVVATRSDGATHVITLNQQTMAGWVTLGEFTFDKGPLEIASRNATEIDGLYFIADAVRIIPLDG